MLHFYISSYSNITDGYVGKSGPQTQRNWRLIVLKLNVCATKPQVGFTPYGEWPEAGIPRAPSPGTGKSEDPRQKYNKCCRLIDQITLATDCGERNARCTS